MFDRRPLVSLWLCAGLLAIAPATLSATGVCGSPQRITCGQTVQGQLDANSCFSQGSFIDTFTFNGLQSQFVIAQVNSVEFAPAVDIIDPEQNVETFTTTNEIDSALPVQALVLGLDSSSSNWRTQVIGSNTGAYSLNLICFGASATCRTDQNTLCLNQGRFQVRATFDAGGGNAGQAHVVPSSPDTGTFWFFSPSNTELIVKVINGCGLGGHYWVFAGGLTNVNVVMTVTDTQTGAVRTYTNPPRTTFLPIQDTSAFATCP